MSDNPTSKPLAVAAVEVPPHAKPSVYPDEFRNRIEGREKRRLGDFFGLNNFGVNLTRLAPGSQSALLHRHSKQDEFIYIIEGQPTLVTDEGEVELAPGMCAGFPAASIAHHLINRTDRVVAYLEIGDRSPGDEGTYPNDDLKAQLGADGNWQFTRKDGSAY